MTAEDKKKLKLSFTAKVVEILKGKVKYGNAEPFNAKGELNASTSIVCSQFSALIEYINGNTKQGNKTGWSGHNAWYYFYKSNFYTYDKTFENNAKVDQFGNLLNAYDWSVTALAYNITLYKNSGINISKLKTLLASKNVTELKKLEGMTFFWNPGNSASDKYTTYTHTGIIGPYDPVTNTFTIYDSNEVEIGKPKVVVQNGISNYNKISLDFLKSFKYFDLYESK